MDQHETTAHPVELPQVKESPQTGSAVIRNLHALQGVKVSLTVVLGHVKLSLGDLMELKEASLLEVDREVDAPVDVVIDGHIVARGQLVVVGDQFGVRVTETSALQ
jgi:flagellar motor switch protein FliN